MATKEAYSIVPAQEREDNNGDQQTTTDGNNSLSLDLPLSCEGNLEQTKLTKNSNHQSLSISIDGAIERLGKFIWLTFFCSFSTSNSLLAENGK